MNEQPCGSDNAFAGMLVDVALVFVNLGERQLRTGSPLCSNLPLLCGFAALRLSTLV